VAVNPGDPDHIVMTNADLFHFTCEYHVSRDGGASWQSGILTAPEGFGQPAGGPTEPCSPVGHGTSAMMGSHAVTFGSGENVYVTFGSAREGEDLSALVARSTDGGETFSTAEVAIPWEGQTDNRLPGVVALARDGQPDRVVVVTDDPTAPALGDEPAAATPRAAVAAVSDDGGDTWSDRVAVTDVPAQEIIVSQDPAGPIYVSYRTRDVDAEGNAVPEGSIRVARSEDGVTWENFHAVDVFGYAAPEDDPQYAGQQYGFANYPRSETGPDGTVYVVYMEGSPVESYPRLPGDVQAQDHYIHPDAEVKLVASTDGGETWSDPTVVNDDPPTAEAGNLWHQVRHPDLSVAPNGRVDVVWHDRRHWYRGCQHTHAACNEGRYGDTYYAHSTDQGQTFSDNVRVSDRTQNNEVGSDYRQGVYWLYSPVSAPLGDDDVFLTWMDSREGNFETDALDIYYSKVDLDHDGDIAERSIPASGAADRSVALARHAYPGGSEATLTATFATRPWTRVVVVNEDDPAAALVGAVLGRAYMGPVLATPAGGLTAKLQAEVERINPLGAFVLGDTDAVSDQVGTQLQQVTETATVRFGGTPAEMAADVAREMDFRGTDQYSRPEDAPAFEGVIVVNPDTDEGVTAAALAANRRLPVLFVESDSIPDATTQALADLDINEALVVGGESSVSDAVLAQLPNATRLGGTDIYETSQAVAQESLDRGLPANLVYVSSEDAMETALTGAAAGRISALQLVTPDGGTDAATTAVTGLGVADQVDRFVLPGDLADRAELTWACPSGAVPASGFTDIAGSTHERAIECAFWYGITAGGPGGLPVTQYGPAQSVRRDQMASFIRRAIDEIAVDARAEIVSDEDVFSDAAAVH
ncbi:MAG TPA: cell wall-binding repeat-containing protein, partial [Egibacteraceae bacterium]|nr:cell wall-binding repeat-containing protein [Egibacteraceae bacterium]